MHEHFTSHQGTPEAVHLPDSAQVTAHLATFDKRAAPKHRDAFKDTLIEVVRENCNDQEWAGLVQRARDLHASQGGNHG